MSLNLKLMLSGPAIGVFLSFLVLGTGCEFSKTTSPSAKSYAGIYHIDLTKWRSEAMKGPHQITSDGVPFPVEDKEWGKMTDWVSGTFLQDWVCNIRPDGTYLLSTPLADEKGTWFISDGNDLVTKPTSVSSKNAFPVDSKPTRISREGADLRCYVAGTDTSQSLPLTLASSIAAK